MESEEKFNKLNNLTFEANMLLQVVYDALKTHEEDYGQIIPIIYLSEITLEKFREIRALF